MGLVGSSFATEIAIKVNMSTGYLRESGSTIGQMVVPIMAILSRECGMVLVIGSYNRLSLLINMKATTAWITSLVMESTPGLTAGVIKVISSVTIVKDMGNYLVNKNVFTEAYGKRELNLNFNHP